MARMNVTAAGYVVVSVFFAVYAILLANSGSRLENHQHLFIFITIPIVLITGSWIGTMIEYVAKHRRQGWNLGELKVAIPVIMMYAAIVLLVVGMLLFTWPLS